MTQDIKAIFFDTGNTLRITQPDTVYQNHNKQCLIDLLGVQESPDVFFAHLAERYAAYKKQTKKTLLQASEIELWTRWMLPDFPASKIAPLATQLTLLWHDRDGHRVPRPDVKQTVFELYQRGYILGIIANAVSTVEIPNWLEADGLAQHFKAVILSSNFGRRKPDLHIYLEAAYVANVKPAKCAYVGDNPNRDIQGARQAGFGMILLLAASPAAEEAPQDSLHKPDGIISQCSDLLKIFPPLK